MWYVFTNHTPVWKHDGDQRYYDKVYAQNLPTEEVAEKIAGIIQEEIDKQG
jgi:hypothetical protein